MAFRIDGDRLQVNSHYAWVAWIFHGCFLIIFPLATIAIWRAGPDKAPFWFSLIFTIGFLAAVPFLLREIVQARLVRATLDRARGSIEIAKQGLLSRSQATATFDDIERIEMRTSDNDGEFHTLYLVFRDGTDLAFRHGNHRQYIEEERDHFLAFVRQRRPDITAIEQSV